MLSKTAVDKEYVDQKELVNVTAGFTCRIVQVSFKKNCPTVRKIVMEKNFSEFEAEGREIVHKNNL